MIRFFDGSIAMQTNSWTSLAGASVCIPERPAQTYGQSDSPHRTAPVWDEQTFQGLSRHLPLDRLRRMLTMFDDQLADVEASLTGARSDRSLWVAKAHGLMSVSGMFGFMRLCDASRFTQEAILVGDATPPVYETLLLAAIAEARRALHDPTICGPLHALRLM